jgi:hypothetical protein
MSEYLSAAELDELAELEKAATPGPWHLHERSDTFTLSPSPTDTRVAACRVQKRGGATWDAKMIAASRNALPKLLAEVRALRDALKAARLSGY